MFKIFKSHRFWNTLWLVLAIAVFVGSFFITRNPGLLKKLGLINLGTSCRFPISYHIGDFDRRFNISQDYLAGALKEAELAWEGAVGSDLFSFSGEGGKLAINLIYDKRQEETEVLKKLGLSIDSTRSSFDGIKTRYDQLRRSYLSGKGEYEGSLAEFEARVAKYEADVEYWNDRGGAPRDEYERLQSEKEALSGIKEALDDRRLALNDLANTVNSLASSLNRLARDLNISIEQYNEGGEVVGKEFEQGVYISDIKGTRINIYQFESREKLVGVLTHELGHALGLDHLENPNSVMYRLNHGVGKQKVTSMDVSALLDACPNLNSD